MRLTQQTTYSIQTLMYCAVNRSGPARIRDVARAYRISELHLFKIMHVLVENRLIETLRGRNGGIRLGRAAHEITLGQVVRATEGTLQVSDCMGADSHSCPIGGSCGLHGALAAATMAFLSVLDRFTIADVVTSPALQRLVTMAESEMGSGEGVDADALVPRPA